MIERDVNGKLVWKPDRSVRPAPVKRTPSLRLVDMRKKLLEKQSEEKDRMAAELKEHEARKAAERASGSPEVNTFAASIAVARGKKPVCLFGSLWYEGEVACLFADSNVGKSILAVQIGQAVAELERKVLYYDFEMQDDMVGQRYMSDGGEPYAFHENLLRPRTDYGMLLGARSAQRAFERIQADVSATGARAVIIDNLTALCPQSETGLDATLFLFGLKDLAEKSGVSVLLLAHTPKRDMAMALTHNDLGGSKRLFNFFDSIFAVGFVPGSKDMRYLKQLKCRLGQVRFDENNVLLMELRKEGDTGFLGFHTTGNGVEREILKGEQQQAASRRPLGNPLEKIVVALRENGVKYEVIAQACGISLGTAAKMVKAAARGPGKTA